MTIHSYVTVSAGEDSLFLLVRQSSGTSGAIGDAGLTALFFPTNYLAIWKSGGETENPEQASRDALDDAKMQAQAEMLRQEFDAKLKAMQEEMKRQLENTRDPERK